MAVVLKKLYDPEEIALCSEYARAVINRGLLPAPDNNRQIMLPSLPDENGVFPNGMAAATFNSAGRPLVMVRPPNKSIEPFQFEGRTLTHAQSTTGYVFDGNNGSLLGDARALTLQLSSEAIEQRRTLMRLQSGHDRLPAADGRRSYTAEFIRAQKEQIDQSKEAAMIVDIGHAARGLGMPKPLTVDDMRDVAAFINRLKGHRDDQPTPA